MRDLPRVLGRIVDVDSLFAMVEVVVDAPVVVAAKIVEAHPLEAQSRTSASQLCGSMRYFWPVARRP